MGHNTAISWTQATRNLVMGCRKVDTDPLTGACVNCYIYRNMPQYGMNPDVLTYMNLEKAKSDLRAWKDVRLIFLNDYSDTFHEDIPFKTILRWHREIIEANPDKEFQLLTKRIGRAMMFYRKYYTVVPRNIWIGTTIGARNRLFRLKQLVEISAKIRWVSFEPLLEDLGEFSLKGIQWAVVGGESGHNPRPMRAEWAENIRRIAERDGVAFYFKQLGGEGGNGAGGNLLEGREYMEMPSQVQGVGQMRL